MRRWLVGVGTLVVAGLRGRRRGGLVATGAVLLLAAFAVSVGLSVVDQGTRQVDAAAREANVAHVVLYGEREAMATAAADPRFTEVAGPFGVAEARLRVDDGEEDASLMAIDEDSIAVGRPLLRSGRWLDPTRDDEVVLDRSAAIELGFEPGDVVTFTSGDRTADLTVVGEAITLTDCGFPQCDPVRAMVSSAALERLGGPGSWVLLARLPDASMADAAAAALLTTVPGVGGSESWPDTRGDLLAVDRMFGRFVTVFGLFVLATASIVVAGSMVVRMATRRREIGLLEAVGCTGALVTTALLGEHLVIGLAAAVVGWLVAGFVSPAFQIGVADVIGASSATWSSRTLAITVVVFATLLVAATVVPAWRAGRTPVSDVVRDVPPAPRSWFARRPAGLPRVLGALGLRDASARPARTALAGLAVALAVVTAIVSAGFIDTVSRLIDDPTAAGEPWDAAVSPTDGTSAVDVVDVLDSTPEVASWFSETSRRSTIGDEAFLSQAIGGDPAAARFDIGAGRAVERSGEAVIGYGMVTRFGLDVGDTVEFSAGDVPLTVEVVGWYREMEDSGEILQYRLEQLRQADPAGPDPDTYRATAADGVDPDSLALVLADRAGGFADVEARETDAAAVDAFVAVLRLVALVIGAVAAVNLLAVMLTSTRESARAIGVEQTLGVTPGQLVGQGAVAAAAIGVVGVVVGVPLGLWLLRLMGDAVTSSMGIGPGYGRLPSPAALTVVAVAAVGVAASLGALAVRRLASRPPADLVRWE